MVCKSYQMARSLLIFERLLSEEMHRTGKIRFLAAEEMNAIFPAARRGFMPPNFSFKNKIYTFQIEYVGRHST